MATRKKARTWKAWAVVDDLGRCILTRGTKRAAEGWLDHDTEGRVRTLVSCVLTEVLPKPRAPRRSRKGEGS